ncbi:MAG: M48 family metallopeptidase [Candidatus Micrarchaeia archaeon]|jgi:heat shock protein HtpX
MVELYAQITRNKLKSYLFMAFLFALVLAICWIASEVTAFGTAGVIVGVFIAAVSAIASYYGSDKLVLAMSGATPADEQQHKKLLNIIEEMSIAAGVPKPRAYVIKDPAINAFATGRDPKHSSIAVTTGAIEKLSRDELEGVIAHEMSHIKNYDIRLMTFAVVMVGSIAIVSDFFLRSLLFGSERKEQKEGGSILTIIGIALALLAPFFAQLVHLAISRKREYLADASAALITRYPKGLADALQKIGEDQNQLRFATKTTAPLYIANPFKKASLSELLSTHPPLEKRIEALRKM